MALGDNAGAIRAGGAEFPGKWKQKVPRGPGLGSPSCDAGSLSQPRAAVTAVGSRQPETQRFVCSHALGTWACP